jgi:hypothetical protein
MIPLRNDLMSLTDYQQVSFSNEELFNVIKLCNYVNGFFSKTTEILNTKALIPTGFIFSDLSTSARLLRNRTEYDLNNFTIVCPEYLNSKMLPYLSVLKHIMENLSDVGDRLLTPLEKWSAKIISEPDYSEKSWLELPNNFKDTEKYRKELSNHFNNSIGDGVNNKPFSAVYTNVEELTTVSKLLDTLKHIALKLLDGKLSHRANNLSTMMFRIKDTEKMVENLSDKTNKMKMVGEIVYNTAKELELLAIVLFQFKTAEYSFTQSLTKINAQLK